jgi:hypothetical protein
MGGVHLRDILTERLLRQQQPFSFSELTVIIMRNDNNDLRE